MLFPSRVSSRSLSRSIQVGGLIRGMCINTFGGQFGRSVVLLVRWCFPLKCGARRLASTRNLDAANDLTQLERLIGLIW